MINPKNTAVFLLGAGLGTRLRPITDTIPKVMIPIAEELPLLEHEILLLKSQGFRDFVVNLHYLPEKITSYFGDGSKWGVSIEYSDESDKILGTAGAIRKAAPLLSDPFILMYGDHLHFFDMAKFLQFHNDHHAFASLVLKTSDLPQNGELAEIDPTTSRIVRWHPRPHGIIEFGDKYLLNTGFYVLPKAIIDSIPEGEVNLDKEVLPPLIASREDIFGYPTAEDILDLGTSEKYEFAKEWYKKENKK